ncbi:MAG: alpha/beta hydrolase family protein [Candidatus Acidiferrales bacterium]
MANVRQGTVLPAHRLIFIEMLIPRPAVFAASVLFLFLVASLRVAMAIGSGQIFKVGVTTRAFVPREPYNWRGSRTHALITTIWYPAAESSIEKPQAIGAPGSPLFLAGDAAPEAKPVRSPSRFPLVLLSHGTGSASMQLAWLGEYLASRGFLVAAVNHPGNNALEPYTIQGFVLWWLRARDLSVVLDDILTDRTFGPRIDQSRIGAAGFSLGGYTVIEIAGAVSNPQALIDYCNAGSPRSRGTCNIHEFPGLIAKTENLLKTDPKFAAAFAEGSKSYRDPRIRAIFAIAPVLGPAFSPQALGKISIPVEIVAGAADPVAPPIDNAEYFARHISGARLVLLAGGVAHYTFLEPCSPVGDKQLPVYCSDAPGISRLRIHDKVAAQVARFFALNLR